MKRAVYLILLLALASIGQQTSVVKTLPQVTMTGSPVALTSPNPVYAHWVVFDCITGNSGKIYIGGSTVSATNGAGCQAGGYAFWPPSGPVYDLSVHYATGTSGDKLNISYQAY